MDPLVGEICDALLQLGGSAHRDKVLEQLGANRSGAVDLRLRARALAVFDAHATVDRLASRNRPLFRKPFGPGKQSWSLTAEAEAFLRAGVVNRTGLRDANLDS
jgi:hypothetical protein